MRRYPVGAAHLLSHLVAGPRPHEQINLTDEESRFMKVAGGGFDQCFNAQGMVNTESMLVIGPHVTQAANDRQ
jgi:hypothetical protein